jgi:hypothetical protein
MESARRAYCHLSHLSGLESPAWNKATVIWANHPFYGVTIREIEKTLVAGDHGLPAPYAAAFQNRIHLPRQCDSWLAII